MRKALEDKLDTFEDFELAFLYKYQLPTYLADTQQKIRDYIFLKRNLSQEQIENLINENRNRKFVDDKERCPRCKSDKIRAEKVEVWNTTYGHPMADALESISQKQKLKDHIICNVCGYVLDDPNESSVLSFKRLINSFLSIFSKG